MPKMKTKSSAKKRFKVLGNGGVKRGHAFKSHILTKKTTKTKRQLTRHRYGGFTRIWLLLLKCCPTLKEFRICHA